MASSIPPRRQVVQAKAKEFLSASFADAWLDLSDVPASLRLPIHGSYLALGFVLFAIFYLEVVQRRLNLPYAISSAIQTATQAITFVGGWAFLLTGALQSRRRILLPIVAFFGLIMLLSLLGSASLVHFMLTVVVGAATLGVALVPALRDRLVRQPLFYFVPVLLLLLGLFVASSFGGQWVGQTVLAFFMMGLLIVVWLLAGLAIVDFAADIARWIVQKLARWFAPGPLFAVVILALFLRLTAGLWLGTVAAILLPRDDAQFAMAVDRFLPILIVVVSEFALTLPIFVWLAALAISRRWTVSSVLTAFAVSLVTPVVTFGLSLAIRGLDVSDVVGTAAEEIGLIPPTLLFVFFLTVTLLTIGSSLTATNGRLIPRPARLYLAVGLILLILNAIFLVTRVQLVGVDIGFSLAGAQDSFFPMGLLIFGLPYLLFLIFRRRARLIGDVPTVLTTRSVVPALDRVPPRLLIGGAVLGGLLLSGVGIVIVELVGRAFGLV